MNGLSPSLGSPSGGTLVTIRGSGFVGVSAVRFGRTAAPFRVTSSTTIIAKAPAGALASVVPVVVSAPGGTSAASSATSFSYR